MTPQTSPWQASYDVSFVTICEIIYRVITAPHYVYFYFNHLLKLELIGAVDLGHHLFRYLLDGDSGGRLNKKDGLTRYGNSHVKDKTS